MTLEKLERFLPPKEHRPNLIYAIPELYYPKQLNVARELVDRHVEAGLGKKVAHYFRRADGSTIAITYRELQRNVNKMGNALKALGVEVGDRVLFSMKDSPQLVYAALGAMKIGAIAVGFSPLARAREIAYFVNDTQAKAMVVQGPPTYLVEELEKVTDEIKGIIKIVIPKAQASGQLSYEDVMAKAGEELEAAPTSRGDYAIMCYTSGTTGPPKGCLHTHRGMLSSADLRIKYNLKFKRNDVLWNMGPAVHSFGHGDKVTVSLRAGVTSVFLEDMSPESLLKAIQDFRITHLVGTASHFRFATEELVKKYDHSSLKQYDALLAEDLDYKRVKALLGLQCLNPMGMAPLFHIFTVPSVKGPYMSLGKITPGYEGYVAPAEKEQAFDEKGNVNEAEPGVIGRLVIRGPTGFTYWNKPHKAAEDVINGWSMLDDAVSRDENGYLFWHSRLDDVIKTSGYNVAPVEVETVLHEHPAIERSAVIGIPDPEKIKGSLIKALIRLKPGFSPSKALEEELKAFVKERIAPYKYPRVIEFSDDLAQDPLGKIRYKELRLREQQKARV